MCRNQRFALPILFAPFILMLLLVDLYIAQTPAVYAESKKLTWNVPKKSQSSASKKGSKWVRYAGYGGGTVLTGTIPNLCPFLLTGDMEDRFWAATPSSEIWLGAESTINLVSTADSRMLLNNADWAYPTMISVELCSGDLDPLPHVYLLRPDGSRVNLSLNILNSGYDGWKAFYLYQFSLSDPAGQYELHFEDDTQDFVLKYQLDHDERAPRFLLMNSEQGLEKHVFYPTETLDMIFYEIHAGRPIELELYKSLDPERNEYEVIADRIITPAIELGSFHIFSYTVQLPLENLEPGQYMLVASSPEEKEDNSSRLSSFANPDFVSIPAQYFYRQHFDIAESDAPILQVSDSIAQDFPEDAESVSHYFFAREGEHLRITTNVSSPTEIEGFYWTVSEPGDHSFLSLRHFAHNFFSRHLELIVSGNTFNDVIATKTDVYKVTLHSPGLHSRTVYNLAIEALSPQPILLGKPITGEYDEVTGPVHYTFVGDAGAHLRIAMDILSDTELDYAPFFLSDEAGNRITRLGLENFLQQTGTAFTSDYRLPFSGTFRLIVDPYSRLNEGFDYRFSVSEISRLTAEDPLSNEPSPVCVHEARFVADITIPDRMCVSRGTELVKVWRIRNAGNCPWGPSHTLNMLVFDSGDQLSSVTEVALPHAVQPGEVVDIEVPITAPDTPGRYRSNWKLRTNEGALIGVGARGVPFYVEIIVP